MVIKIPENVTFDSCVLVCVGSSTPPVPAQCPKAENRRLYLDHRQ